MITHDSTHSQAEPTKDAAAGTAPAIMDPRSPIEVASDGSGTVNDPGASDNRPPGYDDLELLV